MLLRLMAVVVHVHSAAIVCLTTHHLITSIEAIIQLPGRNGKELLLELKHVHVGHRKILGLILLVLL